MSKQAGLAISLAEHSALGAAPLPGVRAAGRSDRGAAEYQALAQALLADTLVVETLEHGAGAVGAGGATRGRW
jgi:hypothetical protein